MGRARGDDTVDRGKMIAMSELSRDAHGAARTTAARKSLLDRVISHFSHHRRRGTSREKSLRAYSIWISRPLDRAASSVLILADLTTLRHLSDKTKRGGACCGPPLTHDHVAAVRERPSCRRWRAYLPSDEAPKAPALIRAASGRVVGPIFGVPG